MGATLLALRASIEEEEHRAHGRSYRELFQSESGVYGDIAHVSIAYGANHAHCGGALLPAVG